MELEQRRFKVSDVVYKVTAKDDGGVNIDRHEVKEIGIIEKTSTFLELGEYVKKKVPIPVINTYEMNNEDLYLSEDLFCSLEDLDKTVKLNINRKKLW